jgi:hypothetical protein
MLNLKLHEDQTCGAQSVDVASPSKRVKVVVDSITVSFSGSRIKNTFPKWIR